MMKKGILIIVAASSIGLVGLVSSVNKGDESSTGEMESALIEPVAERTQVRNDDKNTTDTNDMKNSVYTKLSVISKNCAGCGKCAMIDPEHFKMNTSLHKAEVISQEDLGSDSVSRASSMCRHSAIELS